ncbi:MAG: threonine synthase [Candidatus Marinimicrobia bacterium CG08_land_8_20_14_0_20_45_22]|nr:MAG: threonine synthase [Candidatus Marinimicrobia bacterium CG08_land_8_20_14_0_20_45_22]
MNFKYRCSDCGAEYPADQIRYLCPRCEQIPGEFQKGVLETLLDPEYLASLKNKPAVTPADFLVYQLPEAAAYPVGNTPLVAPEKLRQQYGLPNLFLKNDGANPSGSLKDRASQLVAAQALYHNEKTVVLASTGNAGSAMACAGAALGLNVILFVPATAPKAKLLQSVLYGATVIPIRGTYDDAFRLSIEYTKQFGGINRNTAFNPLTIEGKKTVSIEMFNQLGRSAPDIVFVPVGDGVIYAGVYKGFADLKVAGLIAKIPQIVSVQASGSNAIAKAYQSGRMLTIDKATTAADSISVASPANGRMAIKFMQACSGWATEVSDAEITAAQLQLCQDAGVFVEPAAAAAWAGFLKDKSNLDPLQKIVILLTGVGFKDMNAIENKIAIPPTIEPNLEAIINSMKKY